MLRLCLTLSAAAVLSDAHMDRNASIMVVYGLVGGVFACWFLYLLLNATRNAVLARMAAATFRGEVPLVRGPAVLFGAVEHALGEEHAVRLEVDQRGTEHENSGVWHTKWTEVSRRVQVAPFYLRLASGARVRVEPTEKVSLVDDMDGVIRVDITRRTRSAELIPGEETYAVGELVEGFDPEADGGGYRGSPHGLVLRPPRGRAMSLSSRPLDERFARWTRFDGTAAAFVLLAGMAVQLIWLPFHDRLWNGQTIEATITKLRHFTTKDSEGDTVHHYEVAARAPGLTSHLEDEVDHDDFKQLKQGQKLPWRIVPGRLDHSAVGPEATASGLSLLALLFLPMVLITFFVARRGRRPWYEEDAVEETESGRIEESMKR